MNKRTDDRQRGLAGGAWLALGLVLLAVILLLVLWGPNRGSNGAGQGAKAPAPPPMNTEAMAAELGELGEQFGQVMENRGDADPLLQRIDRLLTQYPDTALAYTLQGQVLMYAGRPDEALGSFRRSLELEPGQAKIHQLAGTLAMRMQRYDLARHHYEQALSSEPEDGSHAVFLANLQHKLGEDEQAITTLLNAIRRDSKLHGAYALLSDIYAEQGKLGLALGQIERALDTAPRENIGIRTAYTLKRAALLRRDNKPAESLALLNTLPTESLLKPDVLRDTATSWGMLDKPAMAAELYERVLVVDPTSDLAAAEAARWRLKAGDTDAARKNLQALRRINPRHEAINELDAAMREADSE